MEHNAAHAALDAHLERLADRLEVPSAGALIHVHHFERELLRHLRFEEREAVPRLDEAGPLISHDHRAIEQRLERVQHGLIDVLTDLASGSRLRIAFADLDALLEHHDRREKDAYESMEACWPDVQPPLPDGDTIDERDEIAIAVARYRAWLAAEPLPTFSVPTRP